MNKKQWEALEAERYDTSYLKPKKRVRAAKPKNNPTELSHLEERFKQMFFHAGRYSAGARDKRAVKEYAAYLAYEGMNEDR